MGTNFDSLYCNSKFGCPMRHNAFDVKGIKTIAIWELDKDFGIIGVIQMLTIGANVYFHLSNNTVWKRDSGANYTQIKSGLNMAGGAVTSLGTDDGLLFVDSQHEGPDRLYRLDDDGTLTTENDDYASAGYAGLINNGAYLFWARDYSDPYETPPINSYGYVRKSGTWELNAISALCISDVPIDQAFKNAVPGVYNYFSGASDYLTVNSYVGTYPRTHFFGVFNNDLYGCNNNYGSSNKLFKLSTYAGGWSQLSTGVEYDHTILRGCYGYGPYLYASGTKAVSGETRQRIYRWDGTTWNLDHLEPDVIGYSGFHRFTMVSGTLLCSGGGRVWRKKIA